MYNLYIDSGIAYVMAEVVAYHSSAKSQQQRILNVDFHMKAVGSNTIFLPLASSQLGPVPD